MLEAIYPSPEVPGSELSLEELRADRRGWLSKVWQSQKPTNSNIVGPPGLSDPSNVETLVQGVQKNLVIAPDNIGLDENGAVKDIGREGRGRRMKIKEVNETQISEL